MEIPGCPAAPADTACDVCIIGAGISGLSIAYTLVQEGLSVVVIDDGAIGSGETGRTSAHLASAVDDHYHVLESLHGAASARLVADSHVAAIDRIESIVARENIRCGFERVDGFLFAAPDEDPGFLDKEMAAAARAGLNPQRVSRAPIPGFDTGPAIRFPSQAQFHPLLYLAHMAGAILSKGGRIYTGHASEVNGGGNSNVTLKGGQIIRCGSIVVATNVPVNDVLTLQTKLAPYRTYVITAPVPAGSLPKALLWDTADPYHYVRVAANADNAPGQDLLVVGGEDHRTGQASDFEARYGQLEMWMRARYPEAGPIHSQWSGQVIETVDGIAYIGRNPGDEKNVYVVTGDSGNGLTHGTIAGILIPDLILGRNNPWEKIYHPGRLTLKAVPEFVSQNIQAASRYFDWLKGHETADEKFIVPGYGAVIRHGLKHVATYRDERGSLHRMSAVCPHLKCIVTWNGSEKTWDCPCHGSRFDCQGLVLNGPANECLATLDPVSQIEANAPKD